MKVKALCFLLAVLVWRALPSCAQQAPRTLPDDPNTLFFEAEDFQVRDGGWISHAGREGETRRASRARALNGAYGNGAGIALQKVTLPRAGTWKLWVRYMVHSAWRGPFEADVMQGERVVGTRVFDAEYSAGTPDWEYKWESLDFEAAAGDYTVRLRKYRQQESIGYVRNVDAVMLTSNPALVPDHVPFNPQTWMKVTLGDGYEKPVYVHIFADHFRDPWYAHYSITKGVAHPDINPTAEASLLSNNESTGWVNMTPTVYGDSGAIFRISPRHTYWEQAKRFKAVIEFAPQPRDDAVVKKFEVDSQPSTFHVVLPSNLETPENVALLRADRDFAAEYGKIADAYQWPTIGKKPVKFPFFLTLGITPETTDSRTADRESKTLSYFGFNGPLHPGMEKYGFGLHHVGGVGWHTKGTYSAPDMEKLVAGATQNYEDATKTGVKAENISYAMIMDEPTGEPASVLAGDAASIEGFRNWLRGKKLTPADLLVASWDEVKPVVESEAEKSPALHYYTQQYRTVALGNFMAIHKKLLHEKWKRNFPVVANFSDGAVYFGNFYGQGVDYFTLMHETDQNALWSEDWSNIASTYQHTSWNVELMRAAARKKKATLGHHLIAYAGRKGFDIRLKGVSEVARGIKMFESFMYGPVWTTHEGSPWQKYPEMWGDHASLVREIGAVEDLLLPAQPQKAQVALLYSSATDAWNLGGVSTANLAYGFERMHTWLALTHAQVPVDVVHESEVADGLLDGYKVCYLSGTHITRAAAQKLAAWVRAGGRLVLAPGAASRDEYNRPLDVLDALLPYKRGALQTPQPFGGPSGFLHTLAPQDTVTAGGAKMDVLSVKQTFTGAEARPGVAIEATFADGAPATVRSAAGKGLIVQHGFLPSLDYMRKALVARGEVQKRAQTLLDSGGIPGPDDVLPLQNNRKSDNPWQYPAEVREAILAPVRAAKLSAPIMCSVPLVDAVYMTAPQGIVIPLANYSLQPIKNMTLDIAVKKAPREVRSVHQGVLKFQKVGANKIRVGLPLDCTDFVTIR